MMRGTSREQNAQIDPSSIFILFVRADIKAAKFSSSVLSDVLLNKLNAAYKARRRESRMH